MAPCTEVVPPTWKPLAICRLAGATSICHLCAVLSPHYTVTSRLWFPFFLKLSLLFPLPAGPWITLTVTWFSLNFTENLEGAGNRQRSQNWWPHSHPFPASPPWGKRMAQSHPSISPPTLREYRLYFLLAPVSPHPHPVTFPQLPLTPSLWSYCSVTVTGSCLCVAASTARNNFVSNSITWSLTSSRSPLEPTDDVLGRQKNSREEGRSVLERSHSALSHARRHLSQIPLSGAGQRVHP